MSHDDEEEDHDDGEEEDGMKMAKMRMKNQRRRRQGRRRKRHKVPTPPYRPARTVLPAVRGSKLDGISVGLAAFSKVSNMVESRYGIMASPAIFSIFKCPDLARP